MSTSHQTVSTCHQTESTKSPDCVHKVTKLCPHVTTFCRRRQEAEAESNQGRSDNGPSALPLGHTGLRLKTVPLVHLLNARLSRSRHVERQVPAGTEIPDTPGVPPRLSPPECLPSRSIVQELCESRGGRPGLSVLTSLLVSVDVKNY